MKQFHVFCGDHYYPESGLGDYVGSCFTLDEAVELAKQHKLKSRSDWAEVLTHADDGSLIECYTGL